MSTRKVVTYRTSDGPPVSARWSDGPAIKVGSRVVWLRPEADKQNERGPDQQQGGVTRG